MIDIDDAISNSHDFSEDFARTVGVYLTAFGQAICALEVWRQRRLKIYSQLLAEIRAMARRNWFISGYFGLSELEELAHNCGTVTPDVLDSRIADMYRSSLAEHGKSLSHDYPTRVFAIQPAIAAHERQEYALSVPLFFAQADGICYDRFQKYIFVKEKDKYIREDAATTLAALANTKPDDSLSRLMEVMWTHHIIDLPIGYSESKSQKETYTGLNRNTVLHGIALDYGTEENSLKAFSLLSHVGALLRPP